MPQSCSREAHFETVIQKELLSSCRSSWLARNEVPSARSPACINSMSISFGILGRLWITVRISSLLALWSHRSANRSPTTDRSTLPTVSGGGCVTGANIARVPCGSGPPPHRSRTRALATGFSCRVPQVLISRQQERFTDRAFMCQRHEVSIDERVHSFCCPRALTRPKRSFKLGKAAMACCATVRSTAEFPAFRVQITGIYEHGKTVHLLPKKKGPPKRPGPPSRSYQKKPAATMAIGL